MTQPIVYGAAPVARSLATRARAGQTLTPRRAALARTAPALTTRAAATVTITVGVSGPAMWRPATATRAVTGRAVTGAGTAPARATSGLLWPRPARTTGS
jgi:hypothetical protein